MIFWAAWSSSQVGLEKETRTFLALKIPGTLIVIGFPNSPTKVEELKIKTKAERKCPVPYNLNYGDPQ